MSVCLEPNVLGLMLALSREQAGLSQQECADALGIQRTMISYWEGGHRSVDPRYPALLSHWVPALAPLARVMGLTGTFPSAGEVFVGAFVAQQRKKRTERSGG